MEALLTILLINEITIFYLEMLIIIQLALSYGNGMDPLLPTFRILKLPNIRQSL
jgi:hypothetical protein